jgi:hypothetical protein
MSHITHIPFHRQTLVAIEHDGQPYVAMRPIVENLGLAWGAQQQKITERFKRCVSMIDTHDSIGRQQKMLCLPLSKIAGFLFSINPSKVKPELRERVIAYQDECDEVLYRHFFGRLTSEHHALIDALFDRHPQWRETVDYLRQGKSSRDIAALQNKHVRNVQRMRARIASAGIDVNPAQAA